MTKLFALLFLLAAPVHAQCPTRPPETLTPGVVERVLSNLFLPNEADATCCSKGAEFDCQTPVPTTISATPCAADYTPIGGSSCIGENAPTGTVTATATATGTVTQTGTATQTATATTAGASFYQDNFNRTQNPLTGCPPSGTGTCWAAATGTWAPSGTKADGALTLSTTTGSAYLMYAGADPNTAGSWACVKTGGTQAANTYAGVAFVAQGTNDMVPCETYGATDELSHGYINNSGTWEAWNTGFAFPGAWVVGDYIAMTHTGGNVVQCWYCAAAAGNGCDDASEWLAAGTAIDLDTIGAGIVPVTDAATNWGVYNEATTSAGWALTGFAAGNTLSSGHPDQAPTVCSGG